MPKYKASILDRLTSRPFYLYIIIAAVIYSLPNLAARAVSDDNPLAQEVIYQAPAVTDFLALVFCVIAFVTYCTRQNGKKIFANHLSTQNLYNMHWAVFEKLVREVFVRLGYRVVARGGARADGGVDLEAYRDRKKTIIQCKHWKRNVVGVSVVREMHSVMMVEKAEAVFIITCFQFSKDAKNWARGNNIHLIHGRLLLEWMKKIDKGEAVNIYKGHTY
ncbi:Restriction endonuclease [Caballeronia peredens]|nr:Restriction endonuclease [Caballeronia peredens]